MIPEHATWLRFPRFVGDAAMQLPILRLLRNQGIGPLVVWGPAATVALVADNELADAVLPDEGRPGPCAMAAILRRYRAARSIHFPKSLRPALAAFLARVPERIGVDESLAGIFNTHSGPFWAARGPFMARYHAVLAKRWPGLPDMPYADYAPRADVRLPAGPYLCLMPGSTWPSKTWPREHFLAVARMARMAGMAVAVLGSPGESETCAFVAQDATHNLCGQTNLVQAAAFQHIVGQQLRNAGQLREPMHEGWRIQFVHDVAEQRREERSLREAQLVFVWVFVACPGVGRQARKLAGHFVCHVWVQKLLEMHMRIGLGLAKLPAQPGQLRRPSQIGEQRPSYGGQDRIRHTPSR